MAAVLLVPFFLLRFGLMAWLDKDALPRAWAFAPVEGGEVFAYWVYQISNTALIIAPFFLRFTGGPLLWAGAAAYLAGCALLAASVAAFCSPGEDGMNRGGVYRYSRNPMYVAYFLVFTGCAGLTASPVVLALTVCFQVSGHWIIRAEERWCIRKFGDGYIAYMKKVRRYLPL